MAVLRADPGAETVTIPDAALFAGTFGRSGSDLILEGPDGESLVVRDYFAGETPPDLVADGARLNGETVESLAGPLAPAQYAQAGPDAGADTEAIGEVTELTGSATVVRTNGAEESLALGDPIFLGDTLRTGAGSSVGVTFIDDTLFSLSEDARLVIDQLIFNPGGGGNELSVSLLQGAAAFLAGQIAPSEGEGMKVTTPVATIGVRGTSVVMFYDAVQRILESILLEDPDGDVGVAGVANLVSSQTLSAFLEGVTVTGLDQLIGPPELVDPSVLLAAKFALVIQSLGANYANFIQNIAPEAGPPQEGGGGGGGGIGEFDPVEGSEATVFLVGPRGELIELEVLIDSVPGFPPPEPEDPNLILLIQEVVEVLTPDPVTLDLDGDNTTDPVLPGGTGGSTGSEVAFVEQGDNLPGSPLAPVVDEDININFAGALTGASVVLTNPLDGALERLTLLGLDEGDIGEDGSIPDGVLPDGITGVFNADRTQLTLSGSAPPDDYEDALRLVRYLNESQNPDESNRIIEIVVNTPNGPSNTAISTIGVTATNDPPIVGIEAPDQEIVGGGTDLAAVADQGPCVPGEFVEDDGPVIVSDKIEITDVDSETMASATATLNEAPDGDDETLGIDAAQLALIAGGAITAELSADGTVLTLTGAASPEDYEAALALVTYDNQSDDPTGESRSISFVVNDGEDESDPLDVEISLQAVNDPPVANPDMNMLTEDGDDTASGNVIQGDGNGGVADEDVDNDLGDLSVTTIAFDGSEDSVNAGGTEISGDFGTLTISSDGSYDYLADFGNEEVDALNVGEMVTDSFTYTITDGEETSTATLDIKIKGANDAPEAGNDLANVMEAVDDAPSNTAEGNVIDGNGEGSEDSDVDNDRADLMVTEVDGEAGDVGQEIEGQFGTLILNADGSYTYTPNDEDEQVNGLGENDTLTESFTYTVSDGDLTDTATLEVVIDGKNDSPIAEDDNDEVMEATEEDEESFTAEGNVIDGSDSDVDSDLMVSAVEGDAGNVNEPLDGAFGTLILNDDGSYTYTPDDQNEQVNGLNVDEMLTDTFTYTISDGAQTDTATLSIKINGKNDAPVANADMNMVTEDAAQDTISGDVINGDGSGGVADEDVDNETADLELTDIAFSDTVEAVEESGTEIEGDFGTLTIFTDGSYDYTVDNQNDVVDGLEDGDMVTDVFTYTLSDGDKSDTASLSIQVKGSNDGPIANADMNMLTEDGDDTASGNVIEGDGNGGVADEDADSAGLTVTTVENTVDGEVSVEGETFVQGMFGALTIFSDGSYDYVADFSNEEVDALNVDEMVTDSFTYTVSDGDETDTTTLDIKIKGVNDAPDLDLDADNSSEEVNPEFTIGATGFEVDFVEETITEEIITSFVGTSALGVGIVNGSGPVPVVDSDVEISDPDSLIASAMVTLTNAPDGADEGLSIDAAALALIASGAITVAASSTTTMLVLEGAAEAADYQAALLLVRYDNSSEDPDETDRLVEIKVTDEDGASSETAVTRISVESVNDVPVAADDMNMVTEDSGETVSGNVIEGDVNGGQADTDPEGVELTVDSVFDPGVFDDVEVLEGTVIEGQFGSVTINPDGSYDYVVDDANEDVDALNVGDMVTDTFFYSVTDGELTDSATLAIKIKGANDAPVAGSDLANVMEAVDDAPSNSAEGNVIDGDGEGSEDSDVDNDRADLMVTEIEGEAGDVGQEIEGQFGTLVLNADGSYTYTPNDEDEQVNGLGENDTLTESFTYTVSDGDLTDTATLEVVIDGKNDSPIAEDDNDEVMEATEEDEESFTAEGNVIDGSDSDVDSDIQVSAVQGNAASVGQQIAGAFGFLTLNDDGSYTYTPDDQNEQVDSLNVDEMLTDTFTYTVSDGDLTDTATLSIKINGKNDAPVAQDDANLVMEAVDGAASNTATGNVIDGDEGAGTDSDVDNERGDLSIFEVDGVTGNVGEMVEGDFGTLILNADGSYTYTPADNDPMVDGLGETDTLTDSFTYTVSDGDKTSTATLDIVINGKNDSPVLDESVMLMTPERVEVFDGGSVGTDGAQGGDVVGTITATDAEDAPEDLTFTIDGGTGEDIFEIDAETGVVMIGPESVKNLNFENQSSYSLDIITTDSDGATDSFTYMVEIKDINDAPEITSADDLCVDEDGGPLSLASLQVADPDADPDDSNLFSVTISVESGDLLVEGTSQGTEVSQIAMSLDDINDFIDSITFEPDPDFGGLVPLSVEVNDQNGDPDQRVVETFEIKVAPVADLPDIFVDDITVYEDNATLMTAGSFESGPFLFKETEENDPSEPDGVPDQLGPLAPASVLAVTGSIATGDAAGGSDLDAYAFTLSESGLVSFDFETEGGLPPNLNLDMTLFNTTGTQFVVSEFNAEEPFFLEAGTYRLELDGFAFDDGVPDVAYSAKISTNLEDKEPVWMAAGDVSQQGTIGADPELAPTDGQFQLLLTTIEANSDADPKSGIPAVPVSGEGGDLNSFFGFEQGELEQSIFRLGPESEILEPVEGSGVKTTFTAEAGQVLTFDWTFLTNEDSDEGPFFDAPFAFVAPLALPSELPTGLETFIAADDATMFERQIDGMFSFTIPATGTYMLGIGVVDIDDSSADSALAIDNVQLDDAPLMSMFFDTDTLHRLPIFTSVVDQDGSETISELTITATIDSKAPLSDITFDGPNPTAFFVLDGRTLSGGDDITYFDDEGSFGVSVDITGGELTLGFGSDGPVNLDLDDFGIELGRHFSGELTIDVSTTVLDDDADVPPAQETETSTATFSLTIEGVADKAEIVDLGGADPGETEDGTPIIAIGQEDAAEPIALPFAVSTPDMDGSECLKTLRLTSLELDFSDPDLFWTFEDEAITGTELAKHAVTLPNLLPGSEDDVDALIWLGGPNGDVLNVEFVDPTLDLREVEIKEIGLQLPENLNGDIKLDIEATTEEHGGPDGLPVMAGAETATQTDWFVLRVEPMNDAPVLEDGNDFTPIAQDDVDNDGDLVSSIVARSDVDETTDGGLPEAFDEGMAIIGQDSTGGTWEFSLDNGATWNSIATVSPTSALLLRSTDKVRFVPNEDYVQDSDFGTDGASLTYRAWDGAPDAVNNIPVGDTAAGGYWAIQETGGKTAFSDGTDTANAQVVAALDINMIITTGSTEASPIPLGILLDGLTEEPDFFTDLSSLPEYLGFGAAIGIGAGDPLFTQTSNPAVGNVIGTDMLPPPADPPQSTGDGLTEVSSFFGLPIAEFTYEAFTDSGAAATTGFDYGVTWNGVTDSASIGIDIRATFDATDRIGGDGIDIIYANPNLEFDSFLPTLRGGGGNDMLVGLDGGEGADNIFGDEGDDLIFGLDSVNFAGFTGNDQLGGDGNDDLTTQGGNDLLFGGDGNDDISGDTGLVGGDIGTSDDAGFAGDDKAFGGAGNDKIYGDAQNNWVSGTLGDDMLFGGADDDDLFGDVGNSIVVTASKGNVTVSGGDDMLVGDNSEGNDNLFGDAGLDLGAQSRGSNVASVIGGNDQLFGDNEDGSGAQADMLFGDAGRNILAGDAGFDGSDVLATGGSATGGNDTASGAGGNDTIIGDAGNDLLGGDAFASTTLVGGLALGGDDILSGEDNDDLVIGDAGGDLSGGDADTSGIGGAAQGGNDSLFGGAGIDTLLGDAGDDLLAGDVFGGSPAGDVTGGDAIGGDDNIMGGDAGDQISGDAGGSLIGGSIFDASIGVISRAGTARGGNDTLNGEMGDDTISGDAGQSLSAGDAFGDAGAILAGGDAIGGNDTLMGEEGNDTLFGDAVTFLSSAPEDGDAEAIGGDDELFGGMGNDDLFGDAGTGFFSDAIGGDDSLFGGAGNDSLIGDTGQTQFGGEAGDDFIDGGAGNDDLWGDSQTLLGSPVTGSDVFFYDLNENSGDDTIHDFEVEKDILRLTELLPDFDTVGELDAAASFTVAQVPGDGNDVTVTLGQGGGTITIQDIGTADGIDSFTELSAAINLEINP